MDFGLKNKFEKIFSSPERILCFWILVFITIGSLLLIIDGLKPLDAFFSAASAVCVTGIEGVAWNQFSNFGKLILMFLIQIGGLGFMTFSFFISWGIFGNSSIGDRHLASELFGFRQISKMRHFLYNILKFTLLIELTGAVIFSFLFSKEGLAQPIFNGIFMSISGFCNAGISPIPHSSLAKLLGNWQIVSVLGTITFLGSIGFPFLHEFSNVLTSYFYKCCNKTTPNFSVDFKTKNNEALCLTCNNKETRFSINSKVAIAFSMALIIFSTATIYFLEAGSGFVAKYGLFNIFFQSIFLRSAGFGVLVIEKLAMPTVLFMTFIMFIGGASGSTAGGIKTSTLALIISSIMSLILKREQVVLFSRTISWEQVKKALSIFIVNIAFIFFILLLILKLEPLNDFFKTFVECVGAISTSGFTFGITKQFSTSGKIIMIFAMIVGRIGVLTFLSIFVSRAQKASFKFPKEKIFIG